jgi:hypothetical protein
MWQDGKGKYVPKYHNISHIRRLIKHHTMKTCWGMEILLHAFLTSAAEVSGQLHDPAALFPGKDHGTQCIEG